MIFEKRVKVFVKIVEDGKSMMFKLRWWVKIKDLSIIFQQLQGRMI
jgi:hypothetical protein